MSIKVVIYSHRGLLFKERMCSILGAYSLFPLIVAPFNTWFSLLYHSKTPHREGILFLNKKYLEKRYSAALKY